MDYIKILVVHNRGVYNFMGIILEAQVSFMGLAVNAGISIWNEE